MGSIGQNLLEVIKPASQTTLKNVVVFVHYIIPYKNLKIEINFHASYLFFGELKDQLLSMGGGGKGQRILRIIWFLGGAEGGSVVSNRIFEGTSGHQLPMGGGGGGGRGHKNTTELQVNFTMTKPKSSDPSPLNDKQ